MNQLKLIIKKIDYICDFELCWSGNSTLSAQVEYPQSLIDLYQKWRNAYFNHYKSLRVKAETIIITQSTEDYHRLLRDAHYQLIDEFQRWLLSPELVKIRRKIVSIINHNPQNDIDLLIACSPNDLTRLPWETWDIGSDLGARNKVRIARTTINNPSQLNSISRFRKPRILTIIGYDPLLDFSQDVKAIESLSQLAESDFIDDKLTQNNADLKQQIFDKITSVDGWDILFFIGHSNESDFGGEFHLAPNLSLKIEDIEKSLAQAAKNGLQLAFFNSCSGIDIGESLIELGLSQVIVMRERVNNKVAFQLLEKFIANLSEYKDVHEAIRESASFFEQENIQQKYPSAYLLPSLYRHPNTKLFRFSSRGERLKRWLPDKRIAKSLLLLLFLSLLSPIQDLLLEARLFTQLIYSQATRQIDRSKQPPTLLVQIDEESFTKANLPWRTREDLDRTYLAQLIHNLHQINNTPKVIGIDYKLWEPKPQEDNTLKQVIQSAEQQNTQFIFAASIEENKTIIPEIANPQTSLQGDIYFYPGYLELLSTNDDLKSRELATKPLSNNSNSELLTTNSELERSEVFCQESCPFAYLLTLVSSQQQASTTQYLVTNNNQDRTIAFLKRLRLHPLSSFAENFGQIWFHPIVDFSIPPEEIYTPLPAWCLLENNITDSPCQPLNNLQQQIAIIAAGGYEEADDNFPVPLALQFTHPKSKRYLTGGEIHAYMVHHFLNRHIVIPIPDILAMLIAAIISQAIVLNIRPSQRQKWIQILLAANIIYVFISLQLYLSLKLLVPLIFPSVLLWNYISISKGSEI
ncbi:MAG: CHASE2 domain-containing protein [Xenococcaceae cyanobacterium MO_188.B32]|nr:CHASE2 domain-containing protein [Xenococcaceae cyanobacterium MO_188.B32]